MSDPREATTREAEQLIAMPGVTGVCTGSKITGGVNTATQAVVVFVAKKKKRIKASDRIPTDIGGVPTDVVQLDPQPMAASTWRTGRDRPVLIGDPVGMTDAGPRGTMGLVYRIAGTTYAMTAGHVLAMRGTNQVEVGREVSAPPGSRQMIGGRNRNRIGHVACPIDMSAADAAAIQLDFEPETLNLMNMLDRLPRNRVTLCGWGYHGCVVNNAVRGRLTGLSRWLPIVSRPTQNSPVAKSGASSGITSGTVYSTDGMIQMAYGDYRVVYRGMTIIHSPGTGKASIPGDSGSVVYRIRHPFDAVAMHIAGHGEWTIAVTLDDALIALHGDAAREYLEDAA